MRRMFDGPTIAYAPEDDEGFDPDLELDDELPEDDADDEVEDEEVDEPEGEVDPEPVPARQPTRGENRVAAATRIASEAKAKTESLERELAALRQQRNEPPRETPAQLQERLANMEPWERTEELRRMDSQATNARLNQIQFESQDSADRTSYMALAARRPIAARLASDVENRLAAMRASGTTAPRETVLKYIIGEQALANESRATGRATKTAAANRDRQAARAPNARADTSPASRRNDTKSARDKRVENMEI